MLKNNNNDLFYFIVSFPWCIIKQSNPIMLLLFIDIIYCFVTYLFRYLFLLVMITIHNGFDNSFYVILQTEFLNYNLISNFI